MIDDFLMLYLNDILKLIKNRIMTKKVQLSHRVFYTLTLYDPGYRILIRSVRSQHKKCTPRWYLFAYCNL